MQDEYSGSWLVNSKGHFPYYKPPDDTGGVSGGDTPAQESGNWMQQINVDLDKVHLVSMDTLQDYADHYGGSVTKGVKYWFVTRMKNGPKEILVDDQNRPYAVVVEPASTAAGTTNNYYTQVDTTINEGDHTEFGPTINDNSTVYNGGDTITNNILNIEDNSVWFPDGTWQFIDNLTYDESTHTYYVDSHDRYTWNDSHNVYETNNYTWEIQYHIEYTSITYIGQTSEYDEQYICYYELPDGRSSADLTAADLEQLSLAFRDVVNYTRSADDVSQRVLYHFDGDTQDSSYWSYCTDFHWDKGASLTYMDEGTFGGSLYLDETEHDFTILLPNTDVVSDFTLQWRYYQSYTAAPQMDSYIELSGAKIFQLDGAKYYTGSGTAIASASIGTWNELCLMRRDGTLYYFINGVPYTSVANTAYFGNSIRFYFGTGQQTFKKLDELRFTKRAIYTPGQTYTPTAVPYDTNLALVLPDGEVPIADEYFEVIPGENNLLASVGLADWTQDAITKTSVASIAQGTYPCLYEKYKLFYNPTYTTVSEGDNCLSVSFSGTFDSSQAKIYMPFQWNAVFIPFFSSSRSSETSGTSPQWNYTFGASKSYCFTVLLADGSYSYAIFSGKKTFGFSSFVTVTSSLAVLSFGPVGNSPYSGSSYYTNSGIFISSQDGSPLDIVYMELVEGTEPSFKLDWKTAVYSSGQLEDSPVLAVRSNLDITSWQIGGVRPSYPKRGQVWALVENSRITSLQQYNGFAWTAVDGRIWTGSRWIPCGSFDVFTLKDLWDIIGGTTDEDYTYIYTESGFWDWWQRSWHSFISKLENWFNMILAALGGGSGDDDDMMLPDNPLVSNEPMKQEDYKGIIKLLRDSYGFFSGFFEDFTAGSIGDFLGFLTDDSGDLYGIFIDSDWGY